MSKEKHYSKSNSRLKQLFSIFSSFLLAAALTVFVLFSCVKLGFTNSSQITKAFSDSNFYNSIYNTLMIDCENEAIISGLSEEIFDDVFSLDELMSYCDSYTISLLNNQEYPLDTSAMKEKLSENIKNYTIEHNLEVDGDIDEVISSFTSTVMAYYQSAIQFPYFDQIASTFRLFDRLLIYILPCMAVFSAILIILLIRLNTFKKNRAYRYLAYSLLSSALSILIIPVFCYITGFYKKLLISPEYMYRFIVSYMENGLKFFVCAGILLFIAGIISIFVSARIKKKLKEEHVPIHHHHHEE